MQLNNKNKELDLKFTDFIEKLNGLGSNEWVVVFSNNDNTLERSTFYSALISEEQAEESLCKSSWDLKIGEGMPGFSFHMENEKEIATYCKNFNEKIEPLVIWRNFHNVKEGHWEILEEFRFYFNLYEDRLYNKFLLIDDNGDAEEVISVSDKEIRIKKRLIKEFLAVKKMRLALFFEIHRFSKTSIKKQGVKEYRKINKKGDNFIYSIAVDDSNSPDSNIKARSFLIGKKLISGEKNFKPKMLNNEKKQCVDFTVGVIKEGEETDHICNKNSKNEEDMPYLARVMFEKNVLIKYYSKPTKYSVEDGYLRCGTLWSLPIDNNQADFIMVFLGDLKQLPYKEQLYWKSFEANTESNISLTARQRELEGKFADPEENTLLFKEKFTFFQKAWKEKFGWYFFKPLVKEDEYHFQTLSPFLTGEQKEFDEKIKHLSLILIESLNEKKLAEGLECPENSKGLGKLEIFLLEKGMPPSSIENIMKFLRSLQKLRSTGVVHRKSEKYKKSKEYFAMDEESLSVVYDSILKDLICILNELENYFVKNQNENSP